MKKVENPKSIPLKQSKILEITYFECDQCYSTSISEKVLHVHVNMNHQLQDFKTEPEG